jgi:hypothetical protein
MKEEKMQRKSDKMKQPDSVYECEPLLLTMLGGTDKKYWKLPVRLTKHGATNAHAST